MNTHREATAAFICMLLIVACGLFNIPGAHAQGLPMATATLVCGTEDDPDRFEKKFTGIFSRADSLVFNAACDESEAVGVSSVQELVDVFAISGPRAQVIADGQVAVDIGAVPDCPGGGNGFGYTGGSATITFSVALSEKRPPPFPLSQVPGRALVLSNVRATVKPPSETFPDGVNKALAAAALFDANGQTIAFQQVETDDGTREKNIINQPFSLDLLTNDQIMEFSKSALIEMEISAQEPCQGGKSHASAFATIDPVFEFDQARFDAEQGANSFPLDEFFQIELSPNLDQPIAAAPPSITIGNNVEGAWFDPASSGQGIYLDYLPGLNVLTAAWFTFEVPNAKQLTTHNAVKTVGAMDQRWLTAVLTIDGDRASGSIFNTTGGFFDTSTPSGQTDTEVGTITIEFTACDEAVLSYDLPGEGLKGDMPVEPVGKAVDSGFSCQATDSGQ